MIRRPPRSTLFSLHDALPISRRVSRGGTSPRSSSTNGNEVYTRPSNRLGSGPRLIALRSEEHTSELQSQSNLVCRLLLEKKKQYRTSRGLKFNQLAKSNGA